MFMTGTVEAIIEWHSENGKTKEKRPTPPFSTTRATLKYDDQGDQYVDFFVAIVRLKPH